MVRLVNAFWASASMMKEDKTTIANAKDSFCNICFN